MKPVEVSFTVNHRLVRLTSLPNRSLLDILRQDLRLEGAKDSCGGEGECGACTVIMNGRVVNSCLVLAGQLDGCTILTIEGLSRGDDLHPIQKAFIEAGAVQCGYCTPGAILSAKALLDQVPYPSREQIREALSGNLCRCTGYVKMIEAVEMAAREINRSSAINTESQNE